MQQQKVIDHCLAIDTALSKARTAGPVVKFIWNAVLTPRIMYPLTVVSLPEPVKTIEALERKAHVWLLPQAD